MCLGSYTRTGISMSCVSRWRLFIPHLVLVAVSLLGLSESTAKASEGIVLLPKKVALHSANAHQQLLLEAKTAAGFVGPVKGEIQWKSLDAKIVEVKDGVLTPIANGKTKVEASVEVGGDTVSASAVVTVTGIDTTPKWEFSRHVLPVLSKSGCNSGSCHGALAGKGGFKLSLRGYNPLADFESITKHAKGRRVELADPGRSLLIAKPSMALPHKGGMRLEKGTPNYDLVVDWIQSGASAPKSDSPTLKQLEVFPDVATLKVGDTQPLLVRATYSDGRQEDVTRWVRFSSTNQTVANVSEAGDVEIVGNGEGAIVAWFSSQIVLFRASVPFESNGQESNSDTETLANQSRRNFIDEHVLAKLAQLNLNVSPQSDDYEFVRRVYLDVIGTLPKIDEVTAFVADKRPDKRDQLIETLLCRSEYVDFWSYKWSDVFLVNGRRLRPKAVDAYYSWINNHVADNTPWDEVVRQVITATGETTDNGATNFYSLHQSPEEMTENVCQAFLSLSIGCAKCHNHPLEKWTNDQYYAMASHFSRVRAKGWGGDGRNGDGVRTVFLSSDGELMQPTTGEPQPPTPLDGEAIEFDAPGDRRAHLAKWVTSPDNPYFARAIANRIWANFFGLGIVNEIDDMRVSNPASNEELLDSLAKHVVESEFDLKTVMRTILQSETYQRSSKPVAGNEKDTQYFSRYFPRRLTAEVLLDAIAQVSDVPTEFTQIGFKGADFQKTDSYPVGTRAIQLADSAVVSSFLKTFGRNERDITCECERSNKPSIVQVLHINNGVTINDRLSSDKSCVAKAVVEEDEAEKIVHEAYMRALSRPPTDDESTRLTDLLSEATEDDSDRRQLVEDLYWSVLSSREFLFNH